MANNPRLAMPALNLYANVVKASQGMFFAENQDKFDKAIFHKPFTIRSGVATITNNLSDYSIVGDSVIITFSFTFTTDADIGATDSILFSTIDFPLLDTTNKAYIKYFVMVQEDVTDFLESRVSIIAPVGGTDTEFRISSQGGNFVAEDTYVVNCSIQAKLP